MPTSIKNYLTLLVLRKCGLQSHPVKEMLKRPNGKETIHAGRLSARHSQQIRARNSSTVKMTSLRPITTSTHFGDGMSVVPGEELSYTVFNEEGPQGAFSIIGNLK